MKRDEKGGEEDEYFSERKQENPMRRQNNGANKLTNVRVEDGLVAADEQMERLVPNTDMATELKKDFFF